MRFDLHLHSCLSPCSCLDQSPAAIVARARAVGLDGIALTDHNSARNCPALAECCRRAGLAGLFGLEIATAEEAHVLTLFDTLAQAEAMTGRVYAALPARANRPEVFGDQLVVDADEGVIEMEPRLLSAPTRLTLREVERQAHALGGLFVACHVDRPAFSIYSQLGVLSGDEGFDALEITPRADEATWRHRAAPHALLRASDAHRPEEIGAAWSEADLPAFTVAALRQALASGAVHLSPRLR